MSGMKIRVHDAVDLDQLVAYLEGQRDTLRRTLQHEAFHQFAYKATGAYESARQ